MALHLVGETIDAKQAHLAARAGFLVPLIRGVYADAGAGIDDVVMAHAVRIARYLYTTAYLASASAVHLGPTPDGRLFISGRRNQRTRIRALEIIQNEAPPAPSLVEARLGDALGEFTVPVAGSGQRFLEAFRLRSEHASAVTDPMRAEMAARLVAEHGSPQAAADALWTLARRNGWYREGEGAERYLLRQPPTARPGNPAALDLTVAWHGEPQGRLLHDGVDWRWRPVDSSGPLLVRETVPGRLPPFIEALLPEGWLAQVLRDRDEREMLRNGRRYMSNVTILPAGEDPGALPDDRLLAPLDAFCADGRFTGRYEGPGRSEIEEGFERNLAAIFAAKETPRLSGVQIKAPMVLRPDGALRPAVGLPFTHILKPAGTSGYEALPLVEWLCLALGEAAGFPVPVRALVKMPQGLPPALLVERFDVRRDAADRRRLALEDFCSLLDLPAADKYKGTIERAARGLRPLSTDPGADLELLFRRALFAWFIADGDMHLKNLAVLKIAAPGADRFTQVRMAPLYDAVTTRVFPGLAQDRMALKLNGRDDRLGRDDFLALARTIDLPLGRAEAALRDIASRLDATLPALSLPAFARTGATARVQDEVKRIVASRIAPYLP
ncbi:MAG TPA: HipA domain-containing protein [Azospirillaceae bacterium]|nr:HipA domain-containing protein [Azospirillaceae bacterium]